MEKTVAEIAALVKGQVVGNPSIRVKGVSGLRQAEPGDITFVSGPKYAGLLRTSRASAVLAYDRLPGCKLPLIAVADPYAAAVQVSTLFNPMPAPMPPPGVHPTAVVGEGVSLGEGAAVGAYAVIEHECTIGARAVIFPHAYIGPGCAVGEESAVYPRAVIRERCQIGARCRIHSGAVIGSDGFGYRAAKGVHQPIPQNGIVVLEDDVEVGANTTIDRATFGKTRIGRGTKIDNLVQIGHNVDIGDHCIVCGMAGVAGSARLGERVTLAAGAGVAGHIEVGAGAIVSGRAGVTKDVKPGAVVSGYPAIDHVADLRIEASRRRIPDLMRVVNELQARVAQLESWHDRKTTNDR